ncbi:MAG: helix-turn-helix domain-containing protein [Cytophagales bacterium]
MGNSISKIIANWLSSFRKYFFFYKDGFYELPYIANSPELIIASFNSMPFVKHYPKKSYFTTNNMFLKGEGYYQKIEEGLWLIVNNIEIKKDLSFKLYYEPGIEANYHTLNIYISREAKRLRFPKLNLELEFVDNTWGLFKAGAKGINSHYKGQKSMFLNIYFSHDWVNDNIASNGVLKNKVLDEFFKSSREYLILPNFFENNKQVYEDVIYSFFNNDEKKEIDVLMLKRNTLQIISTFVEKIDENSIPGIYSASKENSSRRLMKAEYMIRNAIFSEFPSIPTLAKETGISETKLKAEFKHVYGTTMYQYFSNKQMNYAKELLTKKDISIKEVAFNLGFSNPSKFSAAFKKTHGFLPSEV